MAEAFPKLRDEIDAAPASREGEVFYIIYDRAGIAPSRLLLSPLALLVATRLDGQSSILDITDKLSREIGDDSLTCSDVGGIVDALADAMFLDTPAFHDFHAQADRDFRMALLRQPGSAGSAYADDASRLAEDLDKMLAEAPPPEEPLGKKRGYPAGIIVPHIDFMRGANGYGQSYRFLRECDAPRTVVVIGTAHLPLSERFCLCEKDFATPLGTVAVDRDVAAAIREELAGVADVDKDVLAHRGEHSVELQAVWLRHIYGDQVKMVSILANSLGEFIEGGIDPARAAGDPVLAAMTSCLRRLAGAGSVMLMASADLSHAGPRFGDEREVTNKFLAEVEEADRAYLSAVAGDAAAGLACLAEHGDKFHVCGSACIYTVGQALSGRSGRLLGYHQAWTPEMSQAVTYASMVFE